MAETLEKPTKQTKPTKQVATLSQLQITSKGPRITIKEFAHLVPTHFIPQEVRCKLSNVNTALANGLRRTIMSEILCKFMTFDYDDYKCNNPFCINTMIRDRIQLIPLDQKTPITTSWHLDTQNTDSIVSKVYTAAIIGGSGKESKNQAFNPNIEICTLEPSKYIKIDKIIVKQDFPYNFGGCAVAVHAAIRPLDVDMYDQFTRKGEHSSNSNPREFLLSFDTVGTMSPIDILKAGCESIIERLSNVLDITQQTTKSGQYYELVIGGESDTIGNIIARTIHDLYPDILAVTYTVDPVVRRCTIKVKCEEDIAEVLMRSIKYAIYVYESLKGSGEFA